MARFDNRYLRACSVLVLCSCVISHDSHAQDAFHGLEHLFSPPAAYVAPYAVNPPEIDGHISDDAWQATEWSAYFTDIQGKKEAQPYLNTRIKMVWDKAFLYIAAELEEPHVWANLRHHDEVIFHDNDFEVFIDPDNNTHQYFEIEVNALNTIFDLFLAKPYRNNSAALIGWNAPGLRSAVKIRGTLNNPADVDSSWTVELAVPFGALSVGDQVKVPEDGDIWRINFSRVQWDTEQIKGKYVKRKDQSGKVLPEHNWVWSSQGLINMHYPERWGYVQFSEKTAVQGAAAFQLPYSEKQRKYLWLIYYRQKEFYEKNRKYALSMRELGLQTGEIEIEGKRNFLEMEATTAQFTAVIREEGAPGISINEEGLVQTLRSI